jgi:hypothetical protein
LKQKAAQVLLRPNDWFGKYDEIYSLKKALLKDFDTTVLEQAEIQIQI